ncbi:MAG TPA: GNAT family N-acetyltransferase [Candidatus Binataceae bacterium]|nr:GNAT family N-acetyltransferase [Candidatus Binataceae bacterium]
MIRTRVKKIRRRREAGAIVVEQSRDFRRAAALLEAAGCAADGFDRAGVCTLLAYDGADAIGVAAVETAIDCAVMSCLLVAAPRRGRGIGAALVAAARAAAHTRGARTLYAFMPLDESRYLARCDFLPANMEEASAVIAAAFAGGHLPRSRPGYVAAMLDLSRDGIIER